jgi:hypothetical protein
MGETRKKFQDDYCTLDFESWSKESANKMKDYNDNIWGFKRYISFEKFMVNYLWQEADEISACAKGDKEEVLRSKLKGKQNIKQAIRSACLGAASAIQKFIFRSLGNFAIQSAGAILTKKLMSQIWNKFHIPMMNIHDELIVPKGYEFLYEEVKKEVDNFLVDMRQKIPYLNMDWIRMKNWGEKG